MHDFEMELHGIITPRHIADGRDRRMFGYREPRKALRQFRDCIAVAHPYRIAATLLPDAFKERAVGDDLDLGAAEFTVLARHDLAAQLRGHHLLAVADAED